MNNVHSWKKRTTVYAFYHTQVERIYDKYHSTEFSLFSKYKLNLSNSGRLLIETCTNLEF